ncbi:MAG: TRAP transporter large permease [Syntrophomonadaceae bacterium]|nr:TRAP transporter large permease [Syntrophomonadaceae bacterium]MDD4550004.1 TRAP transporter large permease [Syntrophomonadaceae bacterium]
MLTIMLIIMFTLLFLGFPMMMTLLVPGLVAILFFLPGVDPILLVQQLVGGVKSYVLLAIPMFILAADIMATGETANRLVDFVKAFVGHIRGGLAITTIGACGLFGAISGSTQATIAAIGRPMRNKMLQAGYEDSKTMALIVNSSNLAILIPPSSVMIMYAVVTGTSVGELFIAGIGPGLIILGVFSIYNYFSAKCNNIPVESKLNWHDRFISGKKALLALGFPVIVLGGIYSGIFSPTEAAAASVLYALLIETLVYKSLKLRDISEIALSTGIVTAIVFILVAAGLAFSWVISYARIPQMITDSLLGTDPSALKILIVVNVFFFVACMFVDSLIAITVITPIFFPIAVAAGIDPVYLGVLVTMQAGIGGSTPPFGCNVFTASALFNRPYLEVIRSSPAYIGLLLAVTVVFIAFPNLTMFVRNIAFGY